MQFHVSAISLCVLAASLTPVGLPSDLVIKGVMDDAWLADANSAFDRFATQPERIPLVPEAVLRENGHVWPEGSSPLLKGKPAPGPGQKEGEGAIHRPRMGGLYTLPDGHNAPFRRMIAHPKVVQRLNMMLGPGYGHLNYRTAARTLFHRPYLAHFCSFFRRFFVVFSVLAPGFQKVAPKDRGPVA